MPLTPQWVDIDLDEKTRKLRYRHNDLADLEQATGRSLDQLLLMKFYGARVVLQYGLRWMDPKLSATEAGNLIQDHWLAKGKTLDDLGDVIEAALIASGILPQKPQKEPAETPEGNASPDPAT